MGKPRLLFAGLTLLAAVAAGLTLLGSGAWLHARRVAAPSPAARGSSEVRGVLPDSGGGQSSVILAADSDAGGRIARDVCAACHGIDGNSSDPQYPKLAAQKPNYLYRQLRAFKTGAQPPDIMQGIASRFSDAQMKDVARYYSRQVVRPDAIKDSHSLPLVSKSNSKVSAGL